MRKIEAFSNEAAMLCVGAFTLLVATAISNFLRVDVDTGQVGFAEYLGQFMLPAIPLGLVALLLALRSQAAVTVVAGAGAIFYLGYWLVLAA